ncbi:MAG TPA: hypothetical protein VFC56_10435 [Stellaceae bacterium]|nr:hypothetical protein [Stellaceae bacterium]
MPRYATKERVLERLGGSPAEISANLVRFREAAKVLSSDHPRMIDEHPSRWVAVYDGKVAATGRSLNSLLLQLEKKRIPRAETIIRFIDKKERTLIL